MPGIKETPRTITFSQSFLGSYLICPQRAGYELSDIDPGCTSSDATELGTALHMAIECTMDPNWFDPEGKTPHQHARDWLVNQAETDQFLWKKTKTLPTLLTHFDSCWEAFLKDVRPQMGDPLSIEQSFDLPLTVAPDGTELRLMGTWDYEDSNLGLLDWKTSGREWDRGKQNRRIQTAAYTYAYAYMNHPDIWDLDPIDFTYVVHVKGPNPKPAQMLKAAAGPEDWRWLQHIALRVYENMQTNVWALNDTTPLCSELWCDYWDHCKGAVMSGTPVELSLAA